MLQHISVNTSVTLVILWPTTTLLVALALRYPFADCLFSSVINSQAFPPRNYVCCWVSPFDATCSHMGTAKNHPVPDRVKPSSVIFDIRALWRSNMATVGVKGLNTALNKFIPIRLTGVMWYRESVDSARETQYRSSIVYLDTVRRW